MTQENFIKNKIRCNFATEDGRCTLGFVGSGRPKTLLKGNELDKTLMGEVDLVFRKKRGFNGLFNELVFGEKEKITEYKEQIRLLLINNFFDL